jgi:hypothetical protein
MFVPNTSSTVDVLALGAFLGFLPRWLGWQCVLVEKGVVLRGGAVEATSTRSANSQQTR